MIKGIRRKEFNSKLNKCSTRFRPFIGATLKGMEPYVKPIYDMATIFNMTTKRKTTANGVTTRSMHKMKPTNYITEIKRPSPNPSRIPTLILRNSFQTTPLLNSLRLPILLVKSSEDIISEFNEKFQKINERFDQLQINFNNYTNTEKQTNLSVILTNKETEINETIPALISENAQILDKIRLLESKALQNNDSNEHQHIYYQVPVSNSFSTLINMENHEDDSVLTENSLSEGLQLGEWTKVTKKNPKKKENSQPKPILSTTKSTQEVHQIKTPPINISPSPIVRGSSYQHPTNRKSKLFVAGDSHLKRLNKQLFNYSRRDAHAVIRNFDGVRTKR